MFRPITVAQLTSGAPGHTLVLADASQPVPALEAWAGQARAVYMDPPFMTGERYTARHPYGETGWRRGKPAVETEGFGDSFPDRASFLAFLRGLLENAGQLLREDGVVMLHLDWRVSAHARLLCDEVFGEEQFLNEIIWAYESGGRGIRHFSRKHDTILIYGKTSRARLYPDRAGVRKNSLRRNHLRRGVDGDGRAYGSITVRGKEYRYYDDEPVYPGDVWTDIGFLQQRDPERTGYATQKPLKLLERLLLPVTSPGDWVVDLCCGSGTALEAAQRLECRFAGMDLNPEAVAIALSRLKAENLTVVCPCGKGKAELLAGDDPESGRFRVKGLAEENPLFPARQTPEDNLESWETGRIEDGVFYAEQRFARSFRYPELTGDLRAEPGSIRAVMTTDAAGIRRAYIR